MKSYVSTGDHLTVRAPYAIKSDDFVQIGEAFGFAQGDADEGELFALLRTGEFSVRIASNAASVGQFVPVYVDDAGVLTDDPTDARRVGMTGGDFAAVVGGYADTTVILQEGFDGVGGSGGGGEEQVRLTLEASNIIPIIGETITITAEITGPYGTADLEFSEFTATLDGVDISSEFTGMGLERTWEATSAGDVSVFAILGYEGGSVASSPLTISVSEI